MSGKTKEAKEKPRFFYPHWKRWTNCHAIKIKIKRTTSCSNLSAKAREIAKRTACCVFIVNPEQAMVLLSKLSKAIKNNQNDVKNYLYDVGEITLKQLQLFGGF